MAALAKDIPEKKPTDGPAPKPQSQQVAPVPDVKTVNVLSGAAASVCAAAVGGGSFLVGILCGAIVAGGILYVQRQNK